MDYFLQAYVLVKVDVKTWVLHWGSIIFTLALQPVTVSFIGFSIHTFFAFINSVITSYVSTELITHKEFLCCVNRLTFLILSTPYGTQLWYLIKLYRFTSTTDNDFDSSKDRRCFQTSRCFCLFFCIVESRVCLICFCMWESLKLKLHLMLSSKSSMSWSDFLLIKPLVKISLFFYSFISSASFLSLNTQSIIFNRFADLILRVLSAHNSSTFF